MRQVFLRRLGRTIALLCAGLAVLLTPPSATARPGDPDPTFNYTEEDSQRFIASGPLVTDDTGRIYLSGYGGEGVVVARLHPDGALDLSFGDGDGTRSPPPEVEDIIQPYGLGLTPAGALITMCKRIGVGISQDCLWVDDPEDPDPGVIHAVSGNYYRGSVTGGPPQSLAMGPGGEIAMIGNAVRSRESRLLRTIYRFDTDDLVTSKLEDEGAREVFRDAPLWRPRLLKFDSQARLVLLTSRGIVRLNQQGNRDRTFGRSGMFRGEWIQKFVLDGSDRIIVMGQVGDETRIVRLGPNGRRDRSFSRDGEVRLRELPPGFAPRTLVIESGDRALIGFSAYPAVKSAGIRILRLGARGQRDPTFGTGGWVHHPMHNAKLVAFAVTTQRRLIVEVARYFREPGDPRLAAEIRLLAFSLD